MITRSNFTTPAGAQLPYLVTGSGPRHMIYVPGAGDGLASADQLRERMSWWLKGRGEYFRILYVGRRTGLTPQVGLEEQARDIAALLEHLDWPTSLLEGQSAGGALAQQLAVVAPERVGALALSSTMGWLDEAARAQVTQWLELLEAQDWERFFSSMVGHFWSDARSLNLQPFRRLLTRLATPRDPSRLACILNQLLTLDHRDMLGHIQAPTLITGGLDDGIFSPQLQLAMAELIPRAQVVMQPGFGHSNDLENPAHVKLLAAFARLHVRRAAPLAAASGEASLLPSFA